MLQTNCKHFPYLSIWDMSKLYNIPSSLAFSWNWWGRRELPSVKYESVNPKPAQQTTTSMGSNILLALCEHLEKQI